MTPTSHAASPSNTVIASLRARRCLITGLVPIGFLSLREALHRISEFGRRLLLAKTNQRERSGDLGALLVRRLELARPRRRRWWRALVVTCAGVPALLMACSVV